MSDETNRASQSGGRVPPSQTSAPPAAAVAAAATPGRLFSARARLRNYFLTGLIVAGPLTLTIYITWWIIGAIDGWVKPLVPGRYWPDQYFSFSIPGFGLLIAFVALTLLGFLTANLVGRTLISSGETVLERMPVVRGLYRGIKQIFQTAFSPGEAAFRTVGLVQFPTPGTWSLVFISAHPTAEVAAPLPGGQPDDYVGVFLPCSPNPTTGFFFYLPRADVLDISISVDDAAKLVMSAGLIQPEEHQRRMHALASENRHSHHAHAAGPASGAKPD